jgi:hypothetical protein
MKFRTIYENYIYANNDDIDLSSEFQNSKNVKGDLYKSKEHYFYAPNGVYAAGLSYFSHKNGILFISITHSIERGGLLKLFNLLPRTKYIISDINLSSAAFKFWEKIAKDTSKTKVFMDYSDKIVHTFTKYTDIEQKMIKSTDYRIGLKI